MHYRKKIVMLLGSCAITFVKKKIKTIAPINQFNFLPRWLSEKLCQLCNLVCKIWFNPGKGQRSLVLLLLSLVNCRSDRPGNCSAGTVQLIKDNILEKFIWEILFLLGRANLRTRVFVNIEFSVRFLF